MKISASAGSLANAFALAAGLITPKIKIPALAAVRIKAAGDVATITTNVLDFALALTLPASVEAAGELAVPAGRMAGLAAGFAADAMIEIRMEGPVGIVACGRSRYRLPCIPLGDMPPMLALAEETGRIEFAREEALALFKRPAFATSDEETRFYLNGILLHDVGEGLAAVATDGHRLCRLVIPGAAGLSSDYKLLIPNAAVEIARKILRDKDSERVVLRRSRTLLEIATARATFVSRLIDASYPAYERLIPNRPATASPAIAPRCGWRSSALPPSPMGAAPSSG
jgi:DNA polymerase-3 subunit beta